MIFEDGPDQDTFDKWFACDHENVQRSIENTFLLIVGSSTGMLTNLHILSGGEEFTTMAHDCEITGLISHATEEQVDIYYSP